MGISDLSLALLVTALWGINFSVIKIGLGSFDPFLLAALRFIFCALPWVFVFRRPNVPFKYVFWYGLVLGALQFGLLFLGIREGLTAGLASVVLQLQVFFTICFGAIALHERVKARQLAGMALAFAGVVAIAKIGGGASNLLAVSLVVAAAASWGVANIIVKKSGATDMLGFMVWSSLIPPLPLLAIALAVNGPAHVVSDLRHIGWSGLGAVLYLVYPTTLFGYSVWNYLLRKHKTSLVAPLTLLVPIFGMLSSMVIFHEALTATKVVAIVLVIAGLLINMFGMPLRKQAAVNAAAQTTSR
ncbi:EamA family transporter [Burkholderia sp. NLJ2]|uniref:EamA family transporter n=1 Tax=Burkholderia sp. NLJ2 TaxID=3090699 RepID=UPI003C6C119E